MKTSPELSTRPINAPIKNKIFRRVRGRRETAVTFWGQQKQIRRGGFSTAWRKFSQ